MTTSDLEKELERIIADIEGSARREAKRPQLKIHQTRVDDLKHIRDLWADGEVMRLAGCSKGSCKSPREMQRWYDGICSARPLTNHYSLYEGESYCGEVSFAISPEHDAHALLDVKLFPFARGRGIDAKAINYVSKKAAEQGAELACVIPNPANEKALELYEGLGFKHASPPEYLAELCEQRGGCYMERGISNNE